MTEIRMTKGKFERIQMCANKQGIIAALAIDQRNSLKQSMAKVLNRKVIDNDLIMFKKSVSRLLSHQASAILIDPEYGLPALKERAPGTGVLLAYEKTGYSDSIEGRLPDLLPGWNVRRLMASGADVIKFLLYYNPDDTVKINRAKQAFVERIGNECAEFDVPFFLELIAYDNRYDSNSLEFAQCKPRYVENYMREFSKPSYGVDVLKVEIPINIAFMEGSCAFKGAGAESAYDRKTALEWFRSTARAAKKPFIYLSAGVDDNVFQENLHLAAEAEIPFGGVLCGRATWKDGIKIFATQGDDALQTWLQDRGMQNIQNLNKTIAQTAQPWYKIYGGLENINLI